MEVHPFDIKTGGIKSSSNVYDGLTELVIQIKILQEELQIADN